MYDQHCLYCNRGIHGPYAMRCSDRCYIGHIKRGRQSEHDQRARARYREGKKWLETQGWLAYLHGEIPALPIQPGDNPHVDDLNKAAESLLKPIVDRQLVRYAVMRAIFCPECSGILDMDRAVLVDIGKGMCVYCSKCFDKLKKQIVAKRGQETWDHATRDGAIEVTDGRDLKHVPLYD